MDNVLLICLICNVMYRTSVFALRYMLTDVVLVCGV